MNLVQELQTKAKANGKKLVNIEDQLLDQVKENLEMADERNREMLKHFGTSRILETAKSKKATAKKVMAGEWLRESDIKRICNDYALMCLPTSCYKNEVPLRALNDIEKFVKDKQKVKRLFELDGKLYGSNDSGSSNFYAIAPRHHFKFTQRPKNDPVLLFKNEEGHYEIITTWGDDFTFMQRVKGYFSISTTTYIMVIISLFLGKGIDLIRTTADHTFMNGLGTVLTIAGTFAFLICGIAGLAEREFGKPKYNDPYK